MISRILSRTAINALRRTPQAFRLLTVPSYSFNRKIEKAPSNFAHNIEEEIKAEEENITDLSEQLNAFEDLGWAVSR